MTRQLLTRFLSLFLLLPLAAEAAPKNILFYGNSFTIARGFGSRASVDLLVREIAEAAGHEQPNTQSAAVGGQTLRWHRENNLGAISSKLPAGETWDAIVMQEYSTKLTHAFSLPGAPSYPASVEESKADVVTIYNAALSQSPDVVPVLYQTWSRAPDHAFYTDTPALFTDPGEMLGELVTGYEMLKGALDDAAGEDLALIAPVGEAWAAANYDRLHTTDLYHAQDRGTLLAALVLYGTIYGDTTTDDIDLSSVLRATRLRESEGAFLSAAANSVLQSVPEPTSLLLAFAAAIPHSLGRRKRPSRA